MNTPVYSIMEDKNRKLVTDRKRNVMTTVAIVMATYNGEKYLREQIDSILSQTFQDWTLYIRDDGSNDETVDILKKYHESYPQKIVIIDDPNIVGGGSKENFAASLRWVSQHNPHKYYMFSDQDDYWKEDKIQETLIKMREIEQHSDGPILVHTDLAVVDENLQIMGNSFMKYRALNPEVKDLRHLLVQNNITGCTMCWNEQLNELLHLENPDVAMHDWWIALTAASFGTIGYVNKPTILYRQHGDNVVGATRVNTIGFIIKRLTGSAHVKRTLSMACVQARSFLFVFKSNLSESNKLILERFINLFREPKLFRMINVLRGGYLKQGIVQCIGELIFI